TFVVAIAVKIRVKRKPHRQYYKAGFLNKKGARRRAITRRGPTQAMEGNGGAGAGATRWHISRPSAQGAPLADAGSMSIRAVLGRVFSAVDASGARPVLTLGSCDPTTCASFGPPPEADDAVVDALRSRKYNGYSPTVGVLPARRAVAEYL
ncbi:unnamed protein product, partial [Urochloa humidicola]